MILRIINPNTSDLMTQMIRTSAEQAASSGTMIVCEGLARGPEYSDCAFDNILVSHEMICSLLDETKEKRYDAFVVASFADPALDALRQVFEQPVIGIAEAAIHFSTFLGRKYSIISALPAANNLFEDIILRTCSSKWFTSIRVPQCPPRSFLSDATSAKKALLRAARDAIEIDGAEVLLLGGGMLAGYAQELSEDTGVPVLDGVKCAVKLAEAFVSLQVKTSKAHSYSTPFTKPYKGCGFFPDN